MSSISTRIAERTFSRDNSLRATYNTHTSDQGINLPPVFQRWVVLEVIFDPYVFNEQKLEQLESLYGNIPNARENSLVRPPPRNSIIAKPVYNSSLDNKVEAEIAFILYPFFPSTLSMPCKPGEHVWVMFESLSEKKSLGYWMCSIVGPGHVEDVNHSHLPRSVDNNLLDVENQNPAEKHFNAAIKPRYHFKNGRYRKILVNSSEESTGEATVYDPTSVMLFADPTNIPDPDAYERILSESDGSKVSVYESVPRFKKRPGDLALEGSNNTLIVLGRDRTGAVATYLKNEDGFFDIDETNARLNRKNAGSIDIVAGRGQTTRTGGEKVVNDLQNQELAKNKNSLQENEGDPDFANDRSRIYVSQNTFVDSNLGSNFLSKNASKNVLDSSTGDAGIIIKSDKIRIIARSDVQILVTGFTPETQTTTENIPSPDGLQNAETGNSVTFSNTIKNEIQDSKKWASITIKSNGDIVFEPSDFGYIKLGGEDANKGILCTTQPVNAVNGGIAGIPVLTTAGGQIGGATLPTPLGNRPALPQSPALDLGTFSNKVLIK